MGISRTVGHKNMTDSHFYLQTYSKILNSVSDVMGLWDKEDKDKEDKRMGMYVIYVICLIYNDKQDQAFCIGLGF